MLAARALVIAAICFAASGSVGSAVAKEQKSLRVGLDYIFELQGNPGTGYVWRLNQGASENLALVKVDDLGYGESASGKKKLLGAPAPYRFRITGVAPGFAKLVFDYLRPWEGKPEKTEELWVRVPE